MFVNVQYRSPCCTVYGPCSRRILEVFVNTSTEHVNSARYTLRCQRQSSQSECCICLFVSGPLSVCLSVHIFPPCDDLHKITDKPSSEFGGKNLTGQGRRRLDSVPQHFNVLKKLLMCVLCICTLSLFTWNDRSTLCSTKSYNSSYCNQWHIVFTT